MFRPSKELITDPGIRYLEFYGIRYIRSFLMMKIMMTVMGSLPIIAAIITSSLHVMDDFVPFYYIIGGMGGVFMLIAIIFILVFPGKRYLNNIIELREHNDVMELKKILYKSAGMKSTLAMLALIDLGEVQPQMFMRRSYMYGNQQSGLDGL